jgi:hypothetical protein
LPAARHQYNKLGSQVTHAVRRQLDQHRLTRQLRLQTQVLGLINQALSAVAQQ